MVLIDYTNILVDEFAPARAKPYGFYVYFLTHMHTGTIELTCRSL